MLSLLLHGTRHNCNTIPNRHFQSFSKRKFSIVIQYGRRVISIFDDCIPNQPFPYPAKEDELFMKVRWKWSYGLSSFWCWIFLFKRVKICTLDAYTDTKHTRHVNVFSRMRHKITQAINQASILNICGHKCHIISFQTSGGKPTPSSEELPPSNY